MDLNLIIIDNFLPDPDKIRNLALKQSFSGSGGAYPGARAAYQSQPYDSFLDEQFLKILGQSPIHRNASKRFQIVTDLETDDDNWIHHDLLPWAGVLYLSPDAPLEYGTSLYRHKDSKIMYGRDATNEDHLDPNAWEETARVGNIYNRLILYNGEIYHRSTNTGFGNSLETARLTQVFFFELEDINENTSNGS